MTVKTVKSKSETPQKDAKKVQMQKPQVTAEQPFNLVEYLKGVRQEWHKITWPPREQVIAETGVVLFVVTFFSLFVFFLDKVFQFIIQMIT
jgi:preprotein translocase subunit SecE